MEMTKRLQMKTPANQRLAAVIILFVWASVCAAQQTDRIIDWLPTVPRSNAGIPALEIVGIRVNQTQILTGKPFSADEDWLDKLTFRVRNNSDKTVNKFWFNLVFPEIDLGHGGHAGLGILYDATKNPDQGKGISTGSEVEVALAPDKLLMFRQTSMKTGTVRLTLVHITPGAVFFEEGSGAYGFFRRP
jgi:hypothetical protein